MTAIRNSPLDAVSLFENHFYFFHRPQLVFGTSAGIPAPGVTDFEIAEQTVGVFDNIIYNQTGGGDDGQVVVTKT
jgi:hypothetical protein